MKGNQRIRKQLQAYFCMLVLSVQSLTPVMQVSAEEVTTVDVSAQTMKAKETAAQNGEDAVTVSEAGMKQNATEEITVETAEDVNMGVPTCDIATGTFEEKDGWHMLDAESDGYRQVTIQKNGTYRLTGSNVDTGYNFYISVESGLDDVRLVFDDVVIRNLYSGFPGKETPTSAAPAPTTEPPAATTEPPATTTEPPAATTEPPAATTEPPAATTEPPAATTEPPAATTEPPAATTEPPATTEDPVQNSAGKEEQVQAEQQTGMVPSIQAAGTSQKVSGSYKKSNSAESQYTPLILGQNTKVTLQGTVVELDGNSDRETAVWGDDNSTLILEEGFWKISGINVTYLNIQKALLHCDSMMCEEDERLDRVYVMTNLYDLELETVWVDGQKYDVSEMDIQAEYGWLILKANSAKTAAIELMFDGGILYSYRFSKARWSYQQVAPTQEHCTVIYEEEGYEVGRSYCVPGGNVELLPPEIEAQIQYVVKETGENFDGCNVTKDTTVQLLPDTAYGINVMINGEMKQFPRGSSLPEGYFYIETDEDGDFKTVYDCRPGKEKVVVKQPMQLLALQCGDSADHLEFLIDSAESLNAYAILLDKGYQKNDVLASEADLKLTKDITIDSMLRTAQYNAPFCGTLDGQNHTITLDLVADEEDSEYAVGLFQHLTGTVKNLTVDGSIEVEDKDISVGGIAGYVSGENAMVSNCRSDVNIRISGRHIFAGGLVGKIDGIIQISDSSMNGMMNTTGDENYIGGIAGGVDKGNARIDRCHVTSVIDVCSAKTVVSGIVNEMVNAQGMTINNCYTSGEFRRSKTGDSGILIFGLSYAETREMGTTGDSAGKMGILTNCYDYAVEREADNGLSKHNSISGSLKADNCYYATELCKEQSKLTSVTEEQIKSGALCYLLNQGSTEEPVWYQTLGSDPHPVTEADGHAVVYEKTESETGEKFYENAEGTVVSPEVHKYRYVDMCWDTEEGQVIAYGQFRCENCKEIIREPADVTTERTEPKCEDDGEILYTATLTKDGKTYTASREVPIPATGHNYGSWELAANGDGLRVCQNPECDAYEECGHSQTEKKSVSANDCIPVDYEATFCSECGLNISDEQEQESHAYVEELIAPEAQKKSGATCEEKAVYFAICERCHKLDREHTFEAGERAGHTIDKVREYQWNKDNSCDLVYECYECESIQTKQMEITRKVIQERTCMRSGKYVYSAVLEEDGDEYKAPDKEVKVPAAGHALAGGRMKFTETTGTDGKLTVTAMLPIYCGNADCTYKQNIPAVIEAGKNTATCTADGVVTYTAKAVWNAQTYTDTYQVKTTKLGHKLKSHVPQKSATQTDYGVKEYYTCTGCDAKFADRELTKSVADAELIIPKLTPAKDQTPAPSVQPSPQPSQSPKPTVIKQKDGSGITIINKKKKQVSYTGAKKTKTSLTVPSKVKIGKKTYKVTKLADYALKGNKKLKNLTLPKDCNYIGTEAFAGCTKLKTLTIKSKKLTTKTVADNAFKGISKKTVIRVPKSKVDTYRNLFREKGLNKKVKMKAI